jgi:putative transposase
MRDIPCIFPVTSKSPAGGGFARDCLHHLLIHSLPKVALSKLVNSLKGVSSCRLREMCPGVAERYCNGVLWSPSYFAGSCGGAPLCAIAEYVKSQREGAALPTRPEYRGFRAEM